jgi:hypothetical protein
MIFDGEILLNPQFLHRWHVPGSGWFHVIGRGSRGVLAAMGVGAFDADVLELLQKYIEMRSRFGRI